MKKKLNSKIAVATMVGLLNVAQAQAKEHFVPIEDLPPEQRKEIMHEIQEQMGGEEIDWDKIVIGIDDNGAISVMIKSDAELKPLSQPSCFS